MAEDMDDYCIKLYIIVVAICFEFNHSLIFVTILVEPSAATSTAFSMTEATNYGMGYISLKRFSMFEYLYYRLYHYYERCYKFFGGKHAEWNEEDYHYSTSIALSAWEFMLVFCISMTLRVLLPLKAYFQSILFVILFLGSAVASLIYNRKHFKDMMPELNEKYKDSRTDKWLKNWLLMVLYFLSIMFFVFFPFLFSHLLRWILGG